MLDFANEDQCVVIPIERLCDELAECLKRCSPVFLARVGQRIMEEVESPATIEYIGKEQFRLTACQNEKKDSPSTLRSVLAMNTSSRVSA